MTALAVIDTTFAAAHDAVTIRDRLCALGLDCGIRRAYNRDCQADGGLTREGPATANWEDVT